VGYAYHGFTRITGGEGVLWVKREKGVVIDPQTIEPVIKVRQGKKIRLGTLLNRKKSKAIRHYLPE